VITSNTDYDSFRTSCESTLHPIIHDSIGGDMAQMYSCNDPIFWLHHAFMDRMWQSWQSMYGNDFGGAGPGGSPCHTGDNLMGFNYRVQDMFDCGTLCYEYEDFDASYLGDVSLPSPQVTAPATGQLADQVTILDYPTDDVTQFSCQDRQNLNCLRYPQPVSDAFCTMNNLDITTVRTHEANHCATCKRLNEIQGYVSPCALWSRYSLAVEYVGVSQNFCVDVYGFGRISVGYTDSNPFQCISNVRQKCLYTNKNVQLPYEQVRAQVEGLVGQPAFHGAGSVGAATDANSSRSWTLMVGSVIVGLMMLAAF